MPYNIQVSKGTTKKLAGNFGTPVSYKTKQDAKKDLAMLKNANKKVRVWSKIILVRAKNKK